MWPWFGLVGRLVLGGVWLVAGALKLPDPAESVRAVRAYQLLPVAWSRGLQIECGCFGGGGPAENASIQYPVEIARDLALAAVAAYLVWRPTGRGSLDNVLFRPAEESP